MTAIAPNTEPEAYAAISDLKFVSVEAGEGFAIFLTDDGKVYQTGDNYFSPSYRAEYDDETDYEYAEYVAQPTFTLVNTGSHTIEKISVYDNTAYALDSDGRLHVGFYI